MYLAGIGEGERHALFSRRNNSISSAGRVLVYGSLAVVTLAISLVFAIRGAWPILPFAGLECLALFLALRWLHRHAGDYELIAIDGENVIVESSDGGTRERHSINRSWAQVIVESGPGGGKKVFLRSHGRLFEFGKLLSDEAKVSAARRLRQKISDREVQ